MPIHRMPPIMVGALLAERRRERGLTQQQLAGELGVAVRTVQGWENGRIPQAKHRLAIAAFFDPPDEEEAA